MRSMTGFGCGTVPHGDGLITIEIKTVNHRFLEIRNKIPFEFGKIESRLEKLIRTQLQRGYCNVHLSFDAGDTGNTSINITRLNAYLDTLKQLAKQENISLESLIPLVTAAPDLFENKINKWTDTEAPILEACQKALDELVAMRTSEGVAMGSNINAKIKDVYVAVNNIEQISQNHAKEIFNLYKDKINSLLEASDTEPNSARIETEAALLAEKADINEEIIRLKSHIHQMELLQKSSEPIGRKLEFIVQEMARETNTIGSKSVLSEITHLVVDIKGSLEQIRELVQNVE